MKKDSTAKPYQVADAKQTSNIALRHEFTFITLVWAFLTNHMMFTHGDKYPPYLSQPNQGAPNTIITLYVLHTCLRFPRQEWRNNASRSRARNSTEERLGALLSFYCRSKQEMSQFEFLMFQLLRLS